MKTLTKTSKHKIFKKSHNNASRTAGANLNLVYLQNTTDFYLKYNIYIYIDMIYHNIPKGS